MRSSCLPGVNFSTKNGTDLISNCVALLSDEEVRVRVAAGNLLGSLARKFGTVVYEETKGT